MEEKLMSLLTRTISPFFSTDSQTSTSEEKEEEESEKKTVCRPSRVLYLFHYMTSWLETETATVTKYLLTFENFT